MAMSARIKLFIATIASVVVAFGAFAQEGEEVAVRSIPVDASRVMSVHKASDSILETTAGPMTDSSYQSGSSVNTVVGLGDPFGARTGVQVSGGLDEAMSASINRSTLSRLDSVQTGTRLRLSAKAVILRIFIGTVAVLGFGGLFLVVVSRLSGGQAAELA